MNDRRICVAAVLLLAPLLTANAQSVPIELDRQAHAGRTDTATALPVAASFGTFAAQFVGVQQDYAGAVVAGAPYSADAVTESVQMLHDGNRIRQRNEARLYRDSDGRTRREQQLNTLGAWQMTPKASPLVFVHDPVAGEGFMLDADNRSARRLSTPAGSVAWQPGDGASYTFGSSMTLSATAPTATFSLTSGDISVSTEELGERRFGGVTASGSLTRMTIAVETVGNELPIEVVTERWYSSELQVVVLRRHTDPRFGEITYRLTNLSTDEPDAALFAVPADFTIVE